MKNNSNIIPTVDECIKYMAGISPSWKLIARKPSYYLFLNSSMPEQFNNPLAFTLGELRHAFKYGF